jgi:hypothetical protein
MFVRLISHQPAILFSQNKPATSNQTAVLFSQNKSAPVISHQPNEQVQISHQGQTIGYHFSKNFKAHIEYGKWTVLLS